MKVLLDTCVWGGVRKALSDAGHDVVWAGDWTSDPGDQEILHRAHQETRVLVTLDKDFGELAIVRGLPHSGLIRLVNLSTSDQAHHPSSCWRNMAGNSRPVRSSPSKPPASAYDLPPTRHSAAQTERAVDSGQDGVARAPSAPRPF